LLFVVSWLSKVDILDNFREVSKIELIMELFSGRHELRRQRYSQEYRHRGIYDFLR
jgi:hypothetical protein